MENQKRSNEEWKIKRGAMKNGKSREEQCRMENQEWKIKIGAMKNGHCSYLDFPFFIAPLLIFHSSLLLS
jgi:hypothetical protein